MWLNKQTKITHIVKKLNHVTMKNYVLEKLIQNSQLFIRLPLCGRQPFQVL